MLWPRLVWQEGELVLLLLPPSLPWDQNWACLTPRLCLGADTEPNPDFTPIHGNLVGGRKAQHSGS